jgi:D-alanyl-D-alanine carboxypeptidase (penicillin-binding protein 5/6)
MASTTKIMTGLLACESGRLSQTVTVGDINSEGSSIGLKNGYQMTLEALTYGMMLESGNDAAVVCAEFLAGSEEAFSFFGEKHL